MIHLVVKDALLVRFCPINFLSTKTNGLLQDIQGAAAIVNAFHRIATSFNKSSAKPLSLHELLADAGLPQMTPPQAVPGRWNSEVRLMRAVLERYAQVSGVAEVPLPTPDQAAAARELVELLAPFEQASVDLQTEKRPTASVVFPIVSYLQIHFDELDERTCLLLFSIDRFDTFNDFKFLF